MKKLMIAAAVAAMTAGAFADACSQATTESCRAWDVKMTLKTLAAKKIKCTESSACEDVKSVVYYMDNVTRKLAGYLWVCEYACDDEQTYNVVLWDKKGIAVVPCPRDNSDFATVSASEVYAYGKNAKKVAGKIEFDLDNISVIASGINGKLVRGSEEDDCYIKSLSGYVAGTLAYVKPNDKTGGTTTQTLCGEVEEEECGDEYAALLPTVCAACCFEKWCYVEDEAPDLVPAVGTWSMKYNKKVSKGNKSMANLVPAYAL